MFCVWSLPMLNFNVVCLVQSKIWCWVGGCSGGHLGFEEPWMCASKCVCARLRVCRLACKDGCILLGVSQNGVLTRFAPTLPPPHPLLSYRQLLKKCWLKVGTVCNMTRRWNKHVNNLWRWVLFCLFALRGDGGGKNVPIAWWWWWQMSPFSYRSWCQICRPVYSTT